MNIRLFVLCGFLFVSSLGFAETMNLSSLKCSGANGLRLELSSQTQQAGTVGFVDTQLGYFNKRFQVYRVLRISRYGNLNLVRLPLSVEGLPTHYVYDIYLNDIPKVGRKTRTRGVIGNTLYTPVLFPTGGFVPIPYGFVPTTTLTCDVLTAR